MAVYPKYVPLLVLGFLATASIGAQNPAGAQKGAFLGVHIDEVPEPLAAHLDIEGGALITRVLPGSSAETAGIKRHDVIVAVAGEEIGAAGELRAAVRQRRPGEDVELEIRRGRKALKVTAKLGSGEADEKPAARRPGFLGVRYRPLPAALAVHLRLEPGTGVLLDDVIKDSAAARAGIRKYDIVLAVAGKKVKALDRPGASEAEDFVPPGEVFPAGVFRPTNFPALLSKHGEGDTIRLDIIHRGEPRQVDVTLGARPQEYYPFTPEPRFRPWRDRDERGRPRYRFRFAPQASSRRPV